MKKNFLPWMVENRHLLKYYLESFFYLSLCKALTVLLPHKFWGLRYCHFQCETLQENMQDYQTEIQAVRRAVKLLSRYLPWRSRCLDQALAVQRILTRHRLPSTLYLGMIKNSDKKWVAHAWVRCGDQWVIGYQYDKNYSIVGTYARIV
jgi:hypothetical protein